VFHFVVHYVYFGWEGKGRYRGLLRSLINSECVQVKLSDPLRTRAIPERLRSVFTTRRYINPRLPYLTFSSRECQVYKTTFRNIYLTLNKEDAKTVFFFKIQLLASS